MEGPFLILGNKETHDRATIELEPSPSRYRDV